MALNPRTGDDYIDGHVRDATYGDLLVKVAQGNVSLATTDIELGAIEIKDGATDNRASVSAAGALKVEMAGSSTGGLTDTELRATPVPVSMTGSPTGGLTDTELRATPVPVSDGGTTISIDDGAGSVTVDGTFWQATQPVSGPLTDTQLRATAVPVSGPVTDAQLRATAVPVSGPLTDTQLRAAAVPVSGGAAVFHIDDNASTLSVDDGAGSLTVDGTFWQATQPVSGPVTDAQLRATAVPVSGPLTDTQLRATAVPVSGPLTDTQLRATAVPVSGSVSEIPTTSGGLLIKRVLSAATTNSNLAKGSAGQVYGIMATNTNAAVRYLKIYDKATAPTVGTDTPVLTIAIPGNTAGAGLVAMIPTGIQFTLGIGLGITTGVADTDVGAVALNEIIAQVLYK